MDLQVKRSALIEQAGQVQNAVAAAQQQLLMYRGAIALIDEQLAEEAQDGPSDLSSTPDESGGGTAKPDHRTRKSRDS